MIFINYNPTNISISISSVHLLNKYQLSQKLIIFIKKIFHINSTPSFSIQNSKITNLNTLIKKFNNKLKSIVCVFLKIFVMSKLIKFLVFINVISRKFKLLLTFASLIYNIYILKKKINQISNQCFDLNKITASSIAYLFFQGFQPPPKKEQIVQHVIRHKPYVNIFPKNSIKNSSTSINFLKPVNYVNKKKK